MKKLVTTIIVLASFILACGGSIEATSDMTLSVSPSSIDFTDASSTQSTSTVLFQVSVITSDGKPATDVKVYASIDAFWVNSGLVWFPDCPSANTCSCTIGDNGRCSIRVYYIHGAGVEYSVSILFFTGPLSEEVEINVSAQ